MSTTHCASESDAASRFCEHVVELECSSLYAADRDPARDAQLECEDIVLAALDEAERDGCRPQLASLYQCLAEHPPTCDDGQADSARWFNPFGAGDMLWDRACEGKSDAAKSCS